LTGFEIAQPEKEGAIQLASWYKGSGTVMVDALVERLLN